MRWFQKNHKATKNIEIWKDNNINDEPTFLTNNLHNKFVIEKWVNRRHFLLIRKTCRNLL